MSPKEPRAQSEKAHSKNRNKTIVSPSNSKEKQEVQRERVVCDLSPLHTDCPLASWNCPGRHAVQLRMPVVGVMEPGSHGEHASAERPPENLPASQGTHESCPELPWEVPWAHGVQLVEPFRLAAEPALQRVQDTAPGCDEKDPLAH